MYDITDNHMTDSVCLSLQEENKERDLIISEIIYNISQNVSIFPKDPGLVQESLLERRDGTDSGWATVLGEDDICQCYRRE